MPLLLGGARRDAALKEVQPWFERLGLHGLERRRSGELSGPAHRRVQPVPAGSSSMSFSTWRRISSRIARTAWMP
jgi:hypothetical protein